MSVPTAPGGECANCLEPLDTRQQYGPDRAWMGCCLACTELVADQLQVVYDRPDDCPIELLRCAWCGTERSCRPGWHTRCHICLDQRTSPELIDQDITEILTDPASCTMARDFAHLGEDEPITARAVHEAISGYLLLEAIDMRSRPQWTILATDLWGFPWRYGTRSTTHGTWATHDSCGTVQKLTAGRVECRRCPPRARIAHPSRPPRRPAPAVPGPLPRPGQVRPRRRTPRQSPPARRRRSPPSPPRRHDEVINAELRLRAHHHAHVTMGRTGMPTTFGMGTEVLPATTPIDLTGDEVTHLFRPEPSPTT